MPSGITMHGIVSAMAEEFRAMLKDRWLAALVIWLPVLLSLILLSIFSAGLPRQLPIGIVDLDHSDLSRQVSRYLDASPALKVVAQYPSMLEGQPAIKDASIYALVVIPKDLMQDAKLGRAPSISAFFNAQYLLIAKSIRSTLLQVEGTIAAELDVARNIVRTPVFKAALAKSVPVRVQMTSLYNKNSSYAPFLVPGLVAALFQVLMCSVVVLSIGREIKSGDLGYWRRRDLFAGFLGKMLLYAVLFTLHGMLLLYLFFGVLSWPHHGAVLVLLPILFLFVVASQVLGAFFYALTFNLEKSLSIAGAFSAPAFAFLGITFPASDMSVFAAFWRDLMPAAHYSEAFVVQMSYAAGAGALLQPTLILMSFVVLIPWVLQRLRAKIDEDDVSVYSTA